ncbi:mechanosensitive ion channel family protein [Mariniblastus fucicola]|uniref:Small-conductance mechanosensitive channel n=1 Tax=Mariniblastus fucicola TaxID=980251 RepID=A0A5B9PEI8_9BACT|nr:mechanosensitive ion channel family protein [Mariniblastus fucicola]QEG25127.1 Small-conductance mechanosensitive channel [Mariniblastus fucicola]
MKLFYRSSLPVFILLTMFAFQHSFGQQETPDTDNESNTEEVADEAPEAPQKVEVNPAARDEEIQARLNEILAATKRFDDANASVENGVVFLSGIAKQDEFKDWATDLATNTQDVAAVVNRMTVEQKSVWDFSSAFAELRDFRNGAIQAIPLVVFGVVILALTWMLAKLASYVGNRALGKRIPNSLLRWVATRAMMLPILIFGIYLVLRVSGLTQLALTVLGGTGLIGLIIGIAFQDIAENFLASVLISVQKPFRIGDAVHIEDFEGVVQRVTTRGTTLLTFEGNHVQIPNSKVYKATIENYTANPLRRIHFDVGIGYDDPASKAQEIVLGVLKQHSATLMDPTPRVLIESLGASTVNLRSFFWIDGAKNNWLSVRSSCMRIAKQALLQDGISLPDEAREVIFPNGVPVVMQQPPHSENTESNGQQSSPQPGSIEHEMDRKSAAIRNQANEEAGSEAEGHMKSDMEDLKQQAKQSWLPGEGEEVLVGE